VMLSAYLSAMLSVYLSVTLSVCGWIGVGWVVG
ncbi:unnamed protein product, partial [marine sediment metagenome]